MGTKRLAGKVVRMVASTALLATMVASVPAAAPACEEPPTTPFNFTVLSHDGGIFSSIDTVDSTVLAVQGSALVSYDFSGPAPAMTGAAPVPVSGGALYLDGDRGYVVGEHQVVIYDVADPALPRYRGIWSLDSAYTITGFAASGDLAYVGWEKDGYTGTKLVSVADPLAPAIVGYPSMTLMDMRPDLVGDLLFAVTSGGVHVYDLSNPSAPALYGEVAVADCLDAVHDGDYLYVSTGDGVTGEVHIYEEAAVTPGAVIQTVPTLDAEAEWGLVGSETAGYGSSLDIAADRMWRATPTGVELWNIADRANPGLVETDPLVGAFIVAAGADAQHGFVLTGNDEMSRTGLWGFETVSVSGFDTQYWNVKGYAGDTGVDLAGGLVYISSADGMRILDVGTDPSAPALVGAVETTEAVVDVCYFDGRAYLATGDGLSIYDVTDPSAPVLSGVCESVTGYQRVDVTTDTAYATFDGGLVAIDISEVSSAHEIGDWSSPKMVWDLDVDAAGERAYLTYGDEGASDSTLVMLDVTDPTDPELVNSHGIPGGMPHVSTYGDYAYVSMMSPDWGGSAVKIFDVSSGDYLSYLHYFDLGSWNGSDVFAQDGEIYTTGHAVQKWGVYSPTMPYLTGYSPAGGERVEAEGDLVATCSPEGGVTFLAYEAVSFRSFGGDRYDTSVLMSREFDSSEYVVLATGRSFPDALAGVPLAYALNAPILLVESDSIPPEVMAEIDRLGATKAYVLGGDAAVGEGVVDQLEGAGFAPADIVRLWGRTRYETARAIAEELMEVLGGGDVEKVFIATGENFPDALAASGVAAAAGCPILLVKGGDLTTAAQQAIDLLGASEVVIVGGEAAVGPAVIADLGAMGIGGGDIERLSGSNRYATAQQIAEWALADPGAGFDCNDIFVVTGTNFPDALSCGPVAAGNGAPTILVNDDLPAPTRDFVSEHADEIDEVNVVGGTTAVSSAIERWLVSYSE